MTTSKWQVRRATVDDVQKLGALWEQEKLPRQQLEPRFKEFQVVEEEGGELIGALGFLITGTEGCLHSEAFARPEHADALRACLWERIQLQAKNHGLVRIWTQLYAPFWKSSGLELATDAILAKLPPALAASPGAWMCLQLRADLPQELSIDKEFMLLREHSREQRDRVLRQARVLKLIAGLIAVVVFIMAVIWLIFFLKFKNNPPYPG